MTATLLALEPENVGAGPLGLLVVVLMGIATVLLIRNMNTRIKALPKEFPPKESGVPDEPVDPDRPRDEA